MNPINLLDVVALLQDFPERGLQRGQVGTIVEKLAADVLRLNLVITQGEPRQH